MCKTFLASSELPAKTEQVQRHCFSRSSRLREEIRRTQSCCMKTLTSTQPGTQVDRCCSVLPLGDRRPSILYRPRQALGEFHISGPLKNGVRGRKTMGDGQAAWESRYFLVLSCWKRILTAPGSKRALRGLVALLGLPLSLEVFLSGLTYDSM